MLKFSLLSLSILLPFSLAGAQKKIDYPVTKRVDQVDTFHGVTVADPYRWLEEMDSDETRAWARAQDDLAESFLKSLPAREAFRERIASISKYDLYSAPVRARGRYFFTKSLDGVGNNALLYAQDGPNAEPRLVLDPRPDDLKLRAFQHDFYPSNDGRFVACSLVRGQSRWRQMKIIGADGQAQPDLLTGIHAISNNIAWSKDDEGFFYVRFEEPKAGEEMKAAVNARGIYYHRLGSKQSEDRLVYSRPNQRGWIFTPYVTDDGRYLIIDARNGGSSKNHILYSDLTLPKGEAIELFKDDAAHTFLGSRGTRFFFYTDREAPRGRIVAVDIDSPYRMTTVVSESKEPIAGGSLVGGNAVGMFGSRFAAMYLSEASPLIRIFDIGGRLQQTLKLPEGSSVWGGFSGTRSGDEIFYALLTLTSPRTIYRLDLRTGKASVFRRAELNFKESDFAIKQVFYQSKDGTRVPMFLAHKKGIKLDGSNPALMYGYGAFGWNSFLFYQPQVLAWMEMGGIYALPRIRGGGEYGADWHNQGMKLKEQNSIDDFIAAARWLIANKYTSASKLVANGGSASGALVGAAIIQRPELFGAALIDIPVLDMLRYERFGAARTWTQEFGSVENADEFKALLSYSPYHNLKPGRCYPPTLIRVGERDETATPLHGYKFAAAMQAAQGCASPVLLKVIWGAGHNLGATDEQVIESRADELAFLALALRLSPKDSASARN
ncbi:MAG: prolyl oligopeptidase family serine peptidase [Blastocatellia bacterium]|nr:prolyl oligopeptidase family serine peptidase [Blastocatellia bacterium]